MSVAAGGNRPTDAELVAYLDGELDPKASEETASLLKDDAEAQKRLVALARGAGTTRHVFDSLLDAAPRDRLDAILSESIRRHPPTSAPLTARQSGARFLVRAAAVSILVVAGAAGGYFAVGGTPPGFIVDLADFDDSNAWRDTVAQQISLYTRQTVAEIRVNEAVQASELAKLDLVLGLSVSPDAIALPGYTLKRVEVLQYRERPLGQLLYYSPEAALVALCIMNENEADQDPTVERRAGLNLIYWNQNGRAYLLLGAAHAAQLRTLADAVRSRPSL